MHIRVRAAWLGTLALAVALGACGSGASTTGGAGSGGAAGTKGAAGTTGAAGTGAAGTTGGAGTGAAAGATGAAGTGQAGTTGGAGTGAAGTAPDAGIDGPKETGVDAPLGPFALTSTAFTEGMEIPLMYKCAQVKPLGMNLSPPLAWTPGPAGTKSYAVTLNHVASGSAHWALWDIPATTTSLPANVDHVATPPVPAGAKQTMHNAFDGFTGYGYLGPCPQSVNARQMYRYTVYALGVPTLAGATTASTTANAQTAIKNAMLTGGSATLTGTQIQTP